MKPRTIAMIAVGLALAFLTGCETVPQEPVRVQRTSAVFSAPKDRVWPLLVSQVGLDYPVRAIEKESGLLTTDWVTMPAGFNNMNAGRWIVPPGGFLATWSGLRMNMKVMAVETEPGKTQVTINCHYEAFEDNVSKTWIIARTNGTVENAILSRIETAVATAPATQTPAKIVPVAATLPVKSPADSLLELKKLLDAGAITQAEYDAKKASILERF